MYMYIVMHTTCMCVTMYFCMYFHVHTCTYMYTSRIMCTLSLTLFIPSPVIVPAHVL